MTISTNIALSKHTTFKIGGPAKYFCVAQSEADVVEAIKYAKEKGVKIFVLGGGSNLLVSDEGFDGLVVKMEMKGASFEKDGDSILVTSWAGEGWDELVAKTVEWGAWGMENLSAIPGTVGASPVGNIGAYGVEVKDVIDSVRAIDMETGVARTFTNTECQFTYRDSFFKSDAEKKYAVTSVTFRLSSVPRPNLTYKDLKDAFAGAVAAGRVPSQVQIRDTVTKIRAGKFPPLSGPSAVGTAGSFWKNPIIDAEHFAKLKAQYPDMPSFEAPDGRVKVPLAYILDKVCGFKGFSKGNVGLFQNQPLVLVANVGSTAKEVKEFEKEIAKTVLDKTGVVIEKEVLLC